MHTSSSQPAAQKDTAPTLHSAVSALKNGQKFLTHFFELLTAEARLAATSLATMLCLALVSAMSLFLVVLGLTGTLAIILVQQFDASLVTAALTVTALGGLFTAVLFSMAVRLSRHLQFKQSLKQLNLSSSEFELEAAS